MRRTLLRTLAVLALPGMSGICLAQAAPSPGELKPVVTVAFSGYEEVLADIEFIGNLAGQPDLAKGVEQMLTDATGGQGLAGVDKTRPWGAVVQTDGQQFIVHAFVPVSDLKQVMGVVGTMSVGQAPPEPPDGVYEIPTDGPTLFVSQQGGWAFLARSREELANAPADPSALLAGIDQEYDLAVSALIKNVPQMYRQMVEAQLRAGVEMGLPRMPGESDDEYAARVNLTKQMLQQMVTMINELDELVLGFAVDRQAGTAYLDVQITALPGTKTAQQFSEMSAAKTDFAGFNLPGAALTANVAGTLTDADVAQAKAGLTQLRSNAMAELNKQGLSDEELKVATQLLGDLLDVLERTIESKRSDVGAAVLLNPGAVTFLAGGAIAEGNKLESVVKQLAQMATAEEPDLANALTLDAETHQGVRFHSLNLPTAALDPEAARLFGQTLEVVLGISDNSVYLAVGSNAASTLKQVIDGSKAAPGTDVPPMRISLALTPLAQFVTQVSDEGEPAKQIAGMVAGMLAQAGGKDHVTITTTPVANGSRTRLELEEGLLKVLGSLPALLAGPPGAAGEAMKAAPVEATPAEPAPF